jgi:hypothetical protein
VVDRGSIKVVGPLEQTSGVGPGGFSLYGGQVPSHIYSIPLRGHGCSKSLHV